MERLSILNTAAEALWRCWQLRAVLLRIMAVPAIAMIALDFAGHGLRTNFSLPVAMTISAANVLVFAIAAVSCHRVILLGSESVPRFGSNGSSTREWLFAGRVFYLYVIFWALLALAHLLVVLPLLMTGSPVKPEPTWVTTLKSAAWLPISYLTSRASLVLPARAIDEPIGFDAAWRMSAGNGWRLTILIAGLPWLLHLAQAAIARLFSVNEDIILVDGLLYALCLPLEVALLSLCYQKLKR